MNDENDHGRWRLMRDYQQRRFMLACGAIVALLVCGVIGGPIAGTIMFVVLAAVGMTLRIVIGPVALSPLGPVVERLRRRPWRGWEEVLDIVASKLTDPNVIRLTLDGRRVAACLVDVAVDVEILELISSKISIALAEEELTGQYIKAIQASGARLVYSSPPRVVLRGSMELPRGAIHVAGDFRAPAASASPNAVTAALANAPAKTLAIDDEQTLTIPADGGILQLVLANNSFGVAAEPRKSFTVGKSPACDLTLLTGCLDYTSRIHVRIAYEGGHWVLADESTNGTLVNNAQVLEPVGLCNNDLITFGTHPDSPTAVVHIKTIAPKRADARRQ